jgi:molybdopterin molybdotransferase
MIFRSAEVGEYVRARGKDAHAQELMISCGTRLRPQEVGLLAMLGVSRLKVYCRPRLAILPTGDELVLLGHPLRPGKIYESNTYTITAQVEQAGGEAILLGLIADRMDAVKEALDLALEAKVDIILASAGVSVGTYDFIRAAVEQGGKISFWRINMRPGKPFAFGSYRGTPFLGLPGNPVSAFTSFEVFVRPVLQKLAGQTDISRAVIRVELMEAVESDGRESYLRAVVTYHDGRAYARLTGHQDSGNLRSLIQANALLIIPNEVKCLPIGAEVQAWLI